MNNQIKQLVQQATLPGYMLGESYVQSRLDEQKLAELMLVEFTETVKQTAILIAQTGFNDGLSIEEVNKRVNGALRVLDVMRERFGVEE
jgi:hypothetical protein